jgi:predicted outer membrane repeat protein
LALPACAAAITVNTTADNPPTPGECEGVPGDCSLRQAMDLADSVLGPDAITLPAGHYALTIKGAEEDEGNTGDLDVPAGTQISIEGAGARTTVIDAAGLGDRVFDAPAALYLRNLTVANGESDDQNGGGIRSEGLLSLGSVTVRGNVATKSGYGGGVYADGAVVMINGSLLTENRNSGDGGGIFTSGGDVTITNSTIADNVVDTSLYPDEESWGAYGGGMEVSNGILRMQNVTVAGNSIRDGNGGGGGEGTGLAIYPDKGEVLNTIVYGNTGLEVEFLAQCGPLGTEEPNSSAGHNLEQQPPPGEQRCFDTASDLIADPLLGPLANNGGETDTIALPAGSPAIDGGDAGNCPATDQRGLPRPQGGGCDIGAFEAEPTPPAPPAAQPISAPAKPTIKRRGKVKVKAVGKTFLVQTGFAVSCPAGGQSCTGTIKARAPKSMLPRVSASAAKRVPIGKGNFTVAAGKTTRLSLKLNRKGAKMLRSAKRLGAALEIRARAGTGPQETAKAALKLKLPPRSSR